MRGRDVVGFFADTAAFCPPIQISANSAFIAASKLSEFLWGVIGFWNHFAPMWSICVWTAYRGLGESTGVKGKGNTGALRSVCPGAASTDCIGACGRVNLTSRARASGASEDPRVRDRLADLVIRLKVMRLNALRTLTQAQSGSLSREALITKLYWANWHRDLGEVAVDVLGAASEELDPGVYNLSALQRLFLWTRCDTIYAGSNEIQRNIIGERALGLPREPR